MEPKFFKTPAEFRRWLAANHDKKDEIVVGYFKVSTGKPSMTWSESVDQALCFGWIDGVRRRYDDDSYTIRFTPRRQRSIWSSVNIAKVAVLKEKGLMHAAGSAAFEKREDSRSAIYAHENSTELSAEFEQRFRSNKKAWDFFFLSGSLVPTRQRPPGDVGETGKNPQRQARKADRRERERRADVIVLAAAQKLPHFSR
jgi:uncharacterized protein YdeI (YjbR/CyaY-like superfamily)